MAGGDGCDFADCAAMQEVIDTIADKAGIERPKAEAIVGLILGFIKREGPQGAVAKLFAAFPEADTIVAQAAQQAPAAGGFGSLVGGLGSMLGGKAGDALTLAGQLVATGVPMGQIETAAQLLLKAARDEAGPKVVSDILGSLPALSKLNGRAAAT
jgi:hypothetical protein